MQPPSSLPENKPFRGIWFKNAFVLQILTALFHSLSFFNKPTGSNATEQQMIDLMTTYRMEMGAGFSPTMLDLMTALSAGFALLFLLGGLMNWYLWRTVSDRAVIRGSVLIHVFVFGVIFSVNLFLTFLLPVLFSGLVVLCLLLALITWPAKTS